MMIAAYQPMAHGYTNLIPAALLRRLGPNTSQIGMSID
jgi:hypothetical protein